MERSYSYYRDVFADQRLPLAFVDLDHFDQNVQAVAARAGDAQVRVASKSIRCVPLLERVLAADPRFQGVMCFSVEEAVFLSRQGLDNLLVGYPVVREHQLAGLCDELREGKRIVCTVDCPAHIGVLERLARDAALTLPVCIDVSMASRFFGSFFGVRRSPVDDGEPAIQLALRIVESPHLRLEGIMAYEAQIAGLPDRLPGRALRNLGVRFLKRRSIRDVARRRQRIVRAVVDATHELAFVNGGGTGSIESTVAEGCVTEVTVGSAFYGPALFDHFAGFRHLPAAGFAVEIVRIPEPGIYTCFAGGYTASGSLGPEKLPAPYLPKGAEFLPGEGPGEVQTPIVYHGTETLALGDPVFLRHAKAGEFCERFDTLFLVAGGRIVDEVPTYRGEGQCFA